MRAGLPWLLWAFVVSLVGSCSWRDPSAEPDEEVLEVFAYQGEKIPSQVISVALASPTVNWSTSSDADPVPPWLFVRSVGQRDGASDHELQFSAQELPVGLYVATVRFATAGSGLARDQHTLRVRLQVMEPFRAAAEALELDTTLDGSADPRATLELLGRQSSWQIEDVPAWLVLEKTSGQGSATVEARCLKAALAGPGVASATLTISDRLGGRVISLPVRCFAEAHRLMPAERGLAFSRFSNAERLIADVLIEQNGDRPLSWTAEATPSWISVSASGQTGRTMHVAVDPAGLTPGMHYGEIWISNPASPAQIEKIRVGVYLSAAELPSSITHALAGGSDVRDPIRPRIYLLDEQELVARNIYTGQIEETYPLPPTASLLRLCDISDDGASLFLEDLSGWDPSNPLAYRPRDIYRVNLDRPTQPAQLLFTEQATQNGHSNGPLSLRYFRSNGVPVLFNPLGRLHHAETGVVLGEFQFNWSGSNHDWVRTFRPTRVSIAQGGTRFALSNETFPYAEDSIYVYDLRVRAVPGAKARIQRLTKVPRTYPSSLEPGAMLFHRSLDRIYVRFGYLEKMGAEWVYREAFRSEHMFTEAGDGTLVGSGTDGAGQRVLGEFNKDGELVRALSPSRPNGWYLPWVSSDGLAVFATGYGGDGWGSLYGFPR